MNEERTMILQMLKEGAVSVEEAERLLEAIPTEGQPSAVIQPGVVAMPRRILILVSEGQKTKINVKVPFSLVRAGLKFGQALSAFGIRHGNSPEDAAVLEALSTVDIDEVLSSIGDGDISLPYIMVDMEDMEKGQQVKVVLE